MRRSALLAAAICALALGSGVSAADVSWSLGTTAAHSDNAARVQTNKVGDTLLSLAGGLTLTHESRRVQASVDAIGSYVEYLDDTFDSDTLTHADASLVFGIAPERFLWTFEDRLGEITISEFEPARPDNRQNINVFTTGPDFIVRLGSQASLRIGGRFTDSRYGDTDFADDQRVSGSIALVRQISPGTQWSLAAQATQVEFQLPGDPGYDVDSAYVGYSAQNARQSLTVNVGASRLADGGDSQTRPYIDIGWNRQLTPSWTLDIGARSGFSNTADRFANDSAAIDGSTGSVNVSNTPAESVSGDASLTFKRVRTTLVIGAGYSKDDYVGAGNADRESWDAFARLNRRMTQRLNGFLEIVHESRDYDTAGGSDDTQSFGAGLDWRAGRSLYLTAGYRGEERDSDFANGAFKDNVFYLSISYRRGNAAERIGPVY